MRELSLGIVGGRSAGEKLEVVYRETETGAVEIDVRLLAWGEGIGWYPQRTLPLTAHLGPLRALLRRAEGLARSGGRRRGTATVVAFPGGAPADLARPASA